MTIFQFEDEGLAQYSYAIMSDYQIIVVDPMRNPKQYYEFAMMHEAELTGVILTHSHADFVAGHRDISHSRQVPLYVSKHMAPDYRHTALDDRAEIRLGEITLQVLYTPGHSYDSISVLAYNEQGQPTALFSGDTLFIGDVGRPDLRATEEDPSSQKESLAMAMFQTIHQKILPLPDEVKVYPGHGAGTLCGKNLRKEKSSTIGEEKKQNPALQPMEEGAFVEFLTSDQLFIPKYFSHAVQLNRQGPPEYAHAVKNVPRSTPDHMVEAGEIVIDTRLGPSFRESHFPGAINIMDGQAFETWLGSIVAPEEDFYLIAADEEELEKAIDRTTRIGYEAFIKGSMVHPFEGTAIPSPKLDLDDFKKHPENYTILDIRNPAEVKKSKPFADSLNIPLPELRHKIAEVPKNKPIVVHCSGGYRSAIGASLLSRKFFQPPVYDLSEAVKEFGT
jgi:hydroxyacylglutathione hydrolase